MQIHRIRSGCIALKVGLSVSIRRDAASLISPASVYLHLRQDLAPCRRLTASTAPYKYKQPGRQDSTSSYAVVRSALDSLGPTPASYGVLGSFGILPFRQIGYSNAASPCPLEYSDRGDGFFTGVQSVRWNTMVLGRRLSMLLREVHGPYLSRVGRSAQVCSLRTPLVLSCIEAEGLACRPKSTALGSHGGPRGSQRRGISFIGSMGE